MAAPSSSPFPSPTLRRHPLSSPTTRTPAEDLANTWILEFILRQSIPDSLAHEIFLSLPFSSYDLHPHLRKTLLLRRISSELHHRSLSERTLHSLELIEELDRPRGAAPSCRMKVAYCAAAVECTVSALRRSGKDFKDAVERIWMARVVNLMQSEAARGLVSEPLLEWGRRMERCLSSGEGGEEVLKRDVEDAMRLMRDYLEETLEEMGPSFLEIAAAEFVEKRVNFYAVADKVGKEVTENNGFFEKLDDNGKELEDDEFRERSGGMADISGKDLGFGGVREESGPLGGVREESGRLGDASTKQGGDCHGVAGSGFHHVEVEVEDNERNETVGGHDMPNHSGCKIHEVDPGEVSKVKGGLKKSSFDLQMAVEDPLPQAQAVAAAVLASVSCSHVLLNETAKQSSAGNHVLPVSPVELVTRVPTGVDTNTGDLEKEKCNVRRNPSGLKHLEGNHIFKECNKDAEPSKRKASLFERNSTAHTSVWSDDSLEFPISVDKLQSPNPMTTRISPPRLDKVNRVKRRAVKRWTSQEENTLREAVAKYGIGNWKLILNCHSELFEERTEVDLKDKWRNLTRH